MHAPQGHFRCAPLAAALAVISCSSWAQTPPAEDATSTPALEEVVVTAQRREENQQKIPVAVTALSSEEVQKRGISNMKDLLQSAPNLNGFEAPGARGNMNVNMRGVPGGAPSNLSLDPASAMYLDGVYIGKATGAAIDLPDIERIEILRGPQGTLYGRNSTGGAVSFVTKKPTGELHTKATATVGDYGLWGLKFRQDLPRIGTPDEGAGTLAISLSYQTRERDPLYGDTHPDLPGYEDLNRDAYRLALLWQPRENMEVQYAYDHSKLDELSAMQHVVGLTPANAAGLDRIALLKSMLAVPDNQGYNNHAQWHQSLVNTIDYLSGLGSKARPDDGSGDIASKSSAESEGHTLTAQWDFAPSDLLGETSLKSITGYRRSETGSDADLDGIDNSLSGGVGIMNDTLLAALGQNYAAAGQGAIIDGIWQLIGQGGAGYGTAYGESDYDQFSQELQWLGSTEHSTYVLGLFYFSDHAQFDTVRYFLQPFTSGISAPNYKLDSEATAIFGQYSYRPAFADDKLELTAGLRYTLEEKEITYRYLSPLLVPATTYGDRYDQDFQNTSGRLAVAYQLTDNANLYASYATGYRSGGFNGEEYNNPYDEETIKEYEIGAKTDWLDKRLRVNLALFQYKYEDQQVSRVNVSPDGTVTTGINNAGLSNRWGSELEITMLPTDDLQLTLSWGHLHGNFEEYTQFCGTNSCIANSEDLAQRPLSADDQLGLAIDYTAARLGWATLNLHLDGQWQKETFSSALWTGSYKAGAVVTPVAYEPIVLDARTVFNARISLDEIEAGDGTVQVALWSKNLLDEDYRTFGINYASVGVVTAQYGEPRTIGLDVTYEF